MRGQRFAGQTPFLSVGGKRLKMTLECWYNPRMTTKGIALKTINDLPEDASWEDIQERINFVAGVRKGLCELNEGKGIPHEKVKEEFAEWLTN